MRSLDATDKTTTSSLPAHLLGAGFCLLSAAIASLSPLDEQVPWVLGLYLAALLRLALLLVRGRAHPASLLSRLRFSPSVVLFWALAIRVPFLLVEPSLSDDINRYTFEARVVQAGADPYELHPLSDELRELASTSPEWPAINHKELPAIYPPGAQWSLAAVVAMSDDQRFMRAVFTGLDLALIAVLILLLRASGGVSSRALLYAWHPLPALEISGSGHFEPLAILPMVLAFYFWRSGSRSWAWLLWGLSFSTKFVGGVPALFAALASWHKGSRRDVARGLALCVLPVLLLAAPFAVDGTLPLGSFSHYARNWGNFPALFGLFSPVIGYHPARWLCLALLALWTVRIVRVGLEPDHAFVQFFAALLLLSPVVHPWYGLWLLVLIPLYPSLPLFALSSFLPLAYLAWTQQHLGGAWRAPHWAQWLAYGLPLLLLTWQELRDRR